MTGALAVAAAAFEEALEELGMSDADLQLVDPAQFGRRAALLAAGDAIWSQHLGPLLDGKRVQQLLGVGTRQAVNDLYRRQRLLGLPTKDDKVVYAAFQFAATGRPHPAIPEVLRLFKDVVASPYTAASWFVSPQPLLEGHAPAEWLRQGRNADLVKEAARRSAARLGQ